MSAVTVVAAGGHRQPRAAGGDRPVDGGADPLDVIHPVPLHRVCRAVRGRVLLEHEESPTSPTGVALLRSLAAAGLRNADELALLSGPAVRRMERLAARLGDLHERSVTAVLQAAGLAVAERARAEAALGALATLTRLPVPERPSPDQAAAIAAALLDTATRDHARRANTDL